MGGRPPLVSGIMDFLARLALAIGRAGSRARGGLDELSKALIEPPQNVEIRSRREWWGADWMMRGRPWTVFKTHMQNGLARNAL